MSLALVLNRVLMRDLVRSLVLGAMASALACATTAPPGEASSAAAEVARSDEERPLDAEGASSLEADDGRLLPDAVAHEGEAIQEGGQLHEGALAVDATAAASAAIGTDVKELRELTAARRDAVVHLLRKARGEQQRARLWEGERSLLKMADRLRQIEAALRRDPALADDGDLQEELSQMRITLMRMDFVLEVVSD